jgi:hypothetical protein
MPRRGDDCCGELPTTPCDDCDDWAAGTAPRGACAPRDASVLTPVEGEESEPPPPPPPAAPPIASCFSACTCFSSAVTWRHTHATTRTQAHTA